MHSESTQIRKAAILVSSLDSALASRLLDELSPEQAILVEQTARELGPVDPREQDTVIQEFLRIGPMNPPLRSTEDPYDQQPLQRFSQARTSSTPSNHTTVQTPLGNTPMVSLSESEGRRLAHFLRKERPQTVAVVLSYLPQDQAARLLSALPVETQAEAIQRLVDLEETDQDSLREVEQQLTDWISEQRLQQQRRSAGVSAARGILSHYDSHDEQSVINKLYQSDSPLAATITRRPAPKRTDEGTGTYSAPQTNCRPARLSQSPFEASPYNTASERPRAPLSTMPSHTEFESPRADSENIVSNSARPEKLAPAMKWDELSRCNSEVWGMLLENAEPELIVLALAGAPNELVDRLLHSLPAHDSEALSRQLTSLGPTRLSDVETAQAELAAIASRLLRRTEPSSETNPSATTQFNHRAGSQLMVEVG